MILNLITLITEEGSVEGLITKEKIGDQGFGYDPIFHSIELEKNFCTINIQRKK